MADAKSTKRKATPDEKLAELILYIAERCYKHERFGATKLNKILFFSDFLSYRLRGKPITGTEYFKLPMGPAPKPFTRVWAQLARKGDVVMKQSELFGKTQKRTIPLRQPRLDLFDADDIAIVDQVIEWLKDATAGIVSELSHLYIVGWKTYREKEIIPYHSVFNRIMTDEDVTERIMRKGQRIAKEHGLASSSAAA